jgi:hypothetical protein
MKIILSLIFSLMVILGRHSYDFTVIANDFHWAPRTARELLNGEDPYDVTPSPETIPYPLPVALFGAPFVALDWRLATDVFFGLTSGLLFWCMLQRRTYWRLLVFLSYPYLHAWACGQWTPLILAAGYLPVWVPLLVLIKPQIALPVLSRRLHLGGAVLAAVVLVFSLLIYPLWPLRWLSLTGQYEAVHLIRESLGWLLLLSVFFVGKANGRFLLLSALLPFRGQYDLLTLALVPAGGLQMLGFAAASWIIPETGQVLGRSFTLTGLHLYCLACLFLGAWAATISRRNQLRG